MNILRTLFALTFTVSLAGAARAQSSKRFTDSITTLAAAAQGHVGAYFQESESGRKLSSNANDHLPMLSVFKFPLALYILNQVDRGRLFLEQPVSIRKKEWARLRSPLLEEYKQEQFTLPLREILAATVSSSDNAGCDLLLRLIGGPGVVNKYIHGLGVTDINIVATEMQMGADWKTQYTNWCTPAAMGQLLQQFYKGKLLSRESTLLLLKFMTESTSPHRLQGLLPEGTVVAHKTGTSDTNAAGMTAATNDVGIITLPNGHHLIAVVFVADAKADAATLEGTISNIALAAFTYFRKD